MTTIPIGTSPGFPSAVGRQDATVPLTEHQRILHFLGRFTLGATPALVDEVRAMGIESWLDAQLEDRAPASPELDERLAALGSIDLSCREVLDQYAPPYPPDADAETRRALSLRRQIPPAELKQSVLLRAVYGTHQVRETAADFFRNHFCVAVDKGQVPFFAGDYERAVLRGLVFGSFGDMLEASARHPAMLVYLDNAVSRRSPTKAELKEIEMRVRLQTKSKQAGREASDIAAQRGLNENYARELLELHTLGVDNYYTQRDVEEVARALTGWTVRDEPEEPVEFLFRPEMHSKGDKKFLHALIKDDFKHPEAEGEAVLDILKNHEGTARFLSFKLCRHFVRDDPSEAMVRRVTTVFRKTQGSLPALYRAIAEDVEFYAPWNYRAKFKRPFEFVVSALRVVGARIDDPRGVLRILQSMNETLYECKDPTGYYDQAEAWLDPGAFAVRWKFAMDLAAKDVGGVEIPDAFYDELPPGRPERWKEWLLFRLLPSGLDARVSRFLDAKVAEHTAGGTRELEPLARAMVGMILGSPAFQKQ